MFSHVSLGTDDAKRAAAFYDPVLAVLGMRKRSEYGGSVGYGTSIMFFSLEQPTDGRPATIGNGDTVDAALKRAGLNYAPHKH